MNPHSSTVCLGRKLAKFVLWSALLMLFASNAQAQFTVSPGTVSIGIPTGTVPATSAPAAVTLTITTGSVTFTSPSAQILNNPDGAPFAIASNSCTGTMTSGQTCQIAVTFSSTNTSLQTALLSIAATGFDSINVPLSGAFGSMKLFDSTTVSVSSAGTSFTNLTTIGSKPLNLMCPANPTATLSFTPDGVGNLLVDNYIVLSINGTPVATLTGGNPAFPPGNVCSGSDASPDVVNGNTYPECFSQSYRNFVTSLVNQSTDLFVNQNPTTGGNAGGIPFLDISSFLAAAQGEQSAPFPVQATITMVDAGGYVASSTLFLATNCSIAGVSAGGTLTGNPISANNPGSETQTFPINPNPNQNIFYTLNDSAAIQSGNGTVGTVTPAVTPFSLSQTAFAALVQGTSVGPAVCLRMTGLLGPADALGETTQCAGIQIQCQNPADGTTSGNNCGLSKIRDLLDSVQFASPDTPLPATLANTLSTSCAHYLALGGVNGTCAAPSPVGPNPSSLIGPGFLMFGDSQNGPVCPLTAPFDSTSPCPFNALVAFQGAADPLPTGGSAPTRNTIWVPAVNVPLPFGHASVDGHANGWTNSNSVQADFTAFQATYTPTLNNPPANGFKPVPPFSLTWGVTPAFDAQGHPVPIPDTTLPISTDTTTFNQSTSGDVSNPPFCSGSTPSQFSFNTGSALTGLADGLYNIHFFATDCGLSEGLVYNPTVAQQSDPTANWASFQVLSVGVDTVNPMITPSYPNGSNFTVGQTKPAPTVQYACSDDRSGINTCAGQTPPGQPMCPSAPTAGQASFVTPQTALDVSPSKIGVQQFPATVVDCAGNSSSTNVSYTVTAPSATAAIVAVPATAYPAKPLTYVLFAGDVSPAAKPSTIYNGVITVNFTIPAGTLAIGNATSIYADIVCTNLPASPCNITPSGGTACMAPLPVTNSTLSVTVTCAVGNIPDIFTAKTAVGVKITLPISAKPPVGKSISVNGSINADPHQQLSGTTSFKATVPIKSGGN